MNLKASQVVEGLLEYVHEWTFEDTGNGEKNFCEGCGATYSIGHQPKEHKPNCKLKILLASADELLKSLKEMEARAARAGELIKAFEEAYPEDPDDPYDSE